MLDHPVTAIAHSNIAFIKYWGNLNDQRRLPANSSLSMNLSEARTVTTVFFDPTRRTDHLVIDGETRFDEPLERVVAHLDRVRWRAGLSAPAVVETSNSFPMGTGIASSASGFAALTVAAAHAAGLELSERELSALARLGSGSACRSVPGGFVMWHAGDTDSESYAESIASPAHWDLRDIVAVVERAHKVIGSTDGHRAARTSGLFDARLAELAGRFPRVRQALLDRDLATLGPLVEAEALSLHAIALTSRPPILYWTPETVRLLQLVQRWRHDGLPVFFTLDAGPNVHLLCEGHHADELAKLVADQDCVSLVLHNRPAGAAAVTVGRQDEPPPGM